MRTGLNNRSKKRADALFLYTLICCLAVQMLQLRSGCDQCFAGFVAFVLHEVLDEAACQVFGFCIPFGSIGIGVSRIEDAGIHAL